MIYLEWAIAIIAASLFVLSIWGAMLHASDRQKHWEQRHKEAENDNQ
jgi:hypothetical protein